MGSKEGWREIGDMERFVVVVREYLLSLLVGRVKTLLMDLLSSVN